VDTVRYYERQRLVHAALRTRSGYRHFSAETVDRILFIKQAQSLGFSLDEIAEILTTIDSGTVSYARGHARLLAVAARIDAKLAELRAVRRKVSAMLKRCEAGHCAGMDAAIETVRRR
jgi:MerR family transcriptional regulator, copper efflux regulator